MRLVSHDTPVGTSRGKKIGFWLRVMGRGLVLIFSFRQKYYPDVLVLEFGADRPGDLKQLLKIVRPTISVVTAVGDTPVHVEFYDTPADLAREKARLIEALPAAGYAVLNADDDVAMSVSPRTRANLVTFGFDKSAMVHIAAFEHRVVSGIPVGESFKLEYGGSMVPVKLEGVFGRAHAYAAAAAAAVGAVFNMNLVEISSGLSQYHPMPGRMRILPGIKDSRIMDDCYNAAPLSMRNALDTLKDLPARRKIAVLGDMKELGRYSIPAHEAVGDLAAKTANILITVGEAGKLIAAAAKASGMKKDKVMIFETAQEALETVGNLVEAGDLVLVKASHSIGLDLIVQELTKF